MKTPTAPSGNERERTSDIRVITDVTKQWPREWWKPDPLLAWGGVFQAVGMIVLLSYALANFESLWVVIPLQILLGTAGAGLFVQGHECAHNAFSSSTLLNEIVGTILFAPIFWPFHSWRLTHNHHHQWTNHLEKDHLWRPLRRADVENMKWPLKALLWAFYVGPLFFEASILHHLTNLNPWMFSPKLRSSDADASGQSLVYRSVFFAILGGSLTVYTIGYVFELSILKHYVVPFLVFNFWLSTFTYFHHRSPEIGWKTPAHWNKAQAALLGTTHVDYPAWVEFLTFDINWHIPHHISPNVPWYRLRKCTYNLMQRYGDDVRGV